MCQAHAMVQLRLFYLIHYMTTGDLPNLCQLLLQPLLRQKFSGMIFWLNYFLSFELIFNLIFYSYFLVSSYFNIIYSTHLRHFVSSSPPDRTITSTNCIPLTPS